MRRLIDIARFWMAYQRIIEIDHELKHPQQAVDIPTLGIPASSGTGGGQLPQVFKYYKTKSYCYKINKMP